MLGGDPTELSAALNVVQSALASRAVVPQREFARYRINEVLGASSDGDLSAADVKTLRDLLKTQSGWELAKTNGRGALPAGEAVDAFNRILSASSDVGLFIVPVGELERFHPEVGGNKQAWLRQVFEHELFAAAPLEAKELLQGVVQFIQSRQSSVTGGDALPSDHVGPASP